MLKNAIWQRFEPPVGGIELQGPLVTSDFSKVIDVQCPNGHHVQPDVSQVGRTASCITCSAVFVIPADGERAEELRLICIQCPNGHALRPGAHHIGEIATCNECGSRFAIPPDSTRAQEMPSPGRSPVSDAPTPPPQQPPGRPRQSVAGPPPIAALRETNLLQDRGQVATDIEPGEMTDMPLDMQHRGLIVVWLSSLVINLLVLLMLSLVVAVSPVTDKTVWAIARQSDQDALNDPFEVLVDLETPEIEPVQSDQEEIEEFVQNELSRDDLEIVAVEPPIPVAQTSLKELVGMLDNSVPTSELLPVTRSGASNWNAGNAPDGGAEGPPVSSAREMGGRAERRIAFSKPEFDYAFNQGLIWLARHQSADGGWCFDHRGGECRGRCPNPGGKHRARLAATGLALLPFLGAGHSPEHGEYQRVVAAGINYLIENMSARGSLWQPEGRMYGHGIATLALCECYGVMTQESRESTYDASRAVDLERLRRAATAAVDFVVRAQAADGGWRYTPGQLGDTSVVGWQVTALKSASDAGLGTFPKTLQAAGRFFDAVQLEAAGDPQYGRVGIRYAYQPNRLNHCTPATTAIGLTCRIYMGTSPLNPGMKIAVNRIAATGPLRGDMYYNFYANQIMFQHGGPPWEVWTQQLNTHLVETQHQSGHLEGSWYFPHGDHGSSAAGRLYATAMACLCLEESYRHLPIFRPNAQRRFVERLDAME